MMEWIQQYWLTAIFGGIIGFFTLAIKKMYSSLIGRHKELLSGIEKERTEQALLKESLLALMHDRLYQACQYHMRKEYITVEELENLKSLYENYLSIGGNGTGAELYKRCNSLHIVTQKEIKDTIEVSKKYQEE